MSKKEILEFIQRMPDDSTVAEVMDELYFRMQVEKGLDDVRKGRVLTQEELREKIAKWRSSAGR